ncbi:MAG: hypothetical protein RSB67_04225 [Clostridia bacterium]
MIEISKIMDPKLMYSLLIVFGLFIALVILLWIFRRGSKIIKIILFLVFLSSVFFVFYKYIDTNEKIIKESYKDYICGEVLTYSPTLRKVQIDSVVTTFVKGGIGKKNIQIPLNCKVTDKVNNEERKIELKDIKLGDTIRVYTSKNYLEKEENILEAYSIVRIKNGE